MTIASFYNAAMEDYEVKMKLAYGFEVEKLLICDAFEFGSLICRFGYFIPR